ncbi:unnamed protein product [Choristocarpus tenellus]
MLFNIATPMPSQLRLGRFLMSTIFVLYFGAALVGALEVLAVHLIIRTWLEVLVNILISLMSFWVGNNIFRWFQDWVVMDPELDPPMWVLDFCTIS